MADELLTLGANSGTDVTNKVYEEHTVSGAIVTFSDGADAVPLKKCEITLPASLDGYSEVDVKQTKKNLLLPQNADSSSVTVNGITRSYLISSQTFTMTGTNTKTDSAWLIFNGSDWIIDGLKKGETYTFYHNLGVSMYSQITYYDTNGALKALVNLAGSAGKNNIRTFTIPSDFDRIRNFQIGVYASATDVNEEAVFMLCAGSTATTYEAYTAPTTHTAQLGRTIYGGSVDVVSGQGENSYKIITVGNSGWNYYSAGGYIYRDFADKVIPEIGDSDHVLVTDNPDMPYGGVNYASQFQDLHIYQAHNHAIYIKDTSCTSLNDFYTKYSDMKIGYELATPETFTFDPVPIDSKSGNNTLWSEQGMNVEVTYYSEREVINNYNVTATQLTAIADAIREKKGTTNPILFEDFPDEIRTIETGGGGGVKSVEWVYTAGTNGTGDTYNYTATEDGLYLAVAVRYQNTGCSISLPDGGTTVLTSSLSSNRLQLKVVQIEANKRIQMGIYDSSHSRGGWIFKLNVTPNAIAYRRESDSYGDQSFVNQGTSNTVLSIVCTTGTNKFYKWDKTMECYITSPLTAAAQVRIMYGVDMTMPTIVANGPITGQWILSLTED